MSAMEKSDLPEVARKRANKTALAGAELVERRGGANAMGEKPVPAFRDHALRLGQDAGMTTPAS
jgi:hypothetical protein